MFSYSGRVKSPEWRWQRRRADLRHFQIFRHGPVIMYTRLLAGGTYYPFCTFPVGSEAFLMPFLPYVDGYHLPHMLTVPQQKRAYCALLCAVIYRSMSEGSYRVQSTGFPKIVYYRNLFASVYIVHSIVQCKPAVKFCTVCLHKCHRLVC